MKTSVSEGNIYCRNAVLDCITFNKVSADVCVFMSNTQWWGGGNKMDYCKYFDIYW